IREQQLEILISRRDCGVECCDDVAREQLTPQALERGAQQSVSERETLLLALTLYGAPTDHCKDAENLFCIIAQPEQIHGHLAVERALLPQTLGIVAGGFERALDELVEIGS